MIFLTLLVFLPLLPGCSGASLERFEDTREMMDTYIRIVVYAEPEQSQDIIDAAFTRMEEIELIATSWDSVGEAYQLNETGLLGEPSPDMLKMIELSIMYYDITNGYFDITVQPLLDLWSFNPDAEQQFWELDPETQEATIQETLKLIGADKINLKSGVISLKKGSAITLGGIAKGYAGDEALQTIASMGVDNAMIDAGGDIRTIGKNPDTGTWNVALVNPDDTTDLLVDFHVTGLAVTTSGNYERYFNPDKSVHHILNPKTGYSAGECISVTVIAHKGALADSLATGVFAMGPEKGLALVESMEDVETFIVDSERNIHQSSGISEYVR